MNICLTALSSLKNCVYNCLFGELNEDLSKNLLESESNTDIQLDSIYVLKESNIIEPMDHNYVILDHDTCESVIIPDYV